MRIGLVSYRCENRNMDFNIGQIERALKEAQGKVDLLCFGEAFLQGFDSLDWKYETDKKTAVAQDSETMDRLRNLTVQYHTALLTGYIEREGDTLYSSCIVLAEERPSTTTGGFPGDGRTIPGQTITTGKEQRPGSSA